MSTISQRATANIRPVPRDTNDMNRLREEWRLVAKEWVAAQDRADRLEEKRKIALDELTLALVKEGMPVSKAEKEARTSAQFKDVLRQYHDAKRHANNLRIDMQNADRLYWERNNHEATERAERRMAR